MLGAIPSCEVMAACEPESANLQSLRSMTAWFVTEMDRPGSPLAAAGKPRLHAERLLSLFVECLAETAPAVSEAVEDLSCAGAIDGAAKRINPETGSNAKTSGQFILDDLPIVLQAAQNYQSRALPLATTGLLSGGEHATGEPQDRYFSRERLPSGSG